MEDNEYFFHQKGSSKEENENNNEKEIINLKDEEINNLKEDRQEFVNTTHNFNNVRMTGDEFTTNIAGIKQSTEFKLSSNYLQYLMWISIAIFLVIFTFFSYTSDRQSNISLAITGILLLLVLYTILMYLYGKVF